MERIRLRATYEILKVKKALLNDRSMAIHPSLNKRAPLCIYMLISNCESGAACAVNDFAGYDEKQSDHLTCACFSPDDAVGN